MPHNSTRWEIELYENALRFRGPPSDCDNLTPPDRKAGDISSFSDSSRRRLIKKMLRLERSRLSDGLFVTLTYHEEWPDDRQALKSQLNTLLQAMRRRWSSLRYVWRVELQERGAPHFHLLLWRSAAHEWEHEEDIYAWLVDTWQRISGCTTGAHARHGVDLQRLTSWREALAYTSKYVAKDDDIDTAPDLGRRWGASQSLPTDSYCRVHVNERGAHILRRLARKLLSSRGMEDSHLVEHLKNARSALIGMERRTVDDLVTHLQTRDGVDIRAGPLPDVTPQIDPRKEWVRFVPSHMGQPLPPGASVERLQCA